MAGITLVKLALTPLLIAAATLVARRWGQRVGGLVTGLPLTSGPVSVFLSIEHGAAFAARAAVATLVGLAGVAAFCVAYRRAMTAAGPAVACAIALTAYLLALWGLSFGSFGFGAAAALSALALPLTVAAIGRPGPATVAVPQPRWDLPLRMVTAVAMVLAITGAAGALGPAWSGLLSPFPVFISVMAVFTYRSAGRPAAHRLLQGVAFGMFSAAAFFIVVALELEHRGTVLTYAAAAVAALSVNLLSLIVLRRTRAR